jgi:gamma-glutamyl hercynylcysteine S-oxide synthase
MTTSLQAPPSPALGHDEISDLLAEARARTLLLVAPLSDEELTRQHSPLMSPIVWDLGHIGEFEALWLIENLGGEITSGELAGMYDPFNNPRATRGSLPLPAGREALREMAVARDRVLRALGDIDLAGDDPLLENGFVFRMVLQHEYQHGETILQTLQLKQGEPYAAPRGRVFPPAAGSGDVGEMVYFPGGEVVIGSDDTGAAYDNERPAHGVEVAPFRIGRHPVTCGEYLSFVEDGGYRDDDLWSEAGRSWLREAGAEGPMYWERTDQGWRERVMELVRPLDPHRPVCHVCWYEAEAYARWAGARLPTEVEWEAAACYDPEERTRLAFPWGNERPTWRHANLDQLAFDTAPVGTFPLNVSPIGCHGMIGDVWEWTASTFEPYPGNRTFPYKEYSEVFFGDEYRVLRGGSWATRPGAIRGSFRNWDYPIRRQIFAGFRLAADG